MSGLAEVTDATFKPAVLENARPTIVDFWAEW
jgi:thioredoxin-like negative regulator of GroEL